MGARLRTGLFLLSWAISYAAQAESFAFIDGDDIIGERRGIYSRHEETLPELARRHDLGLNELTLANPGVDLWLPGEGTRIVLPAQYLLPNAPRQGIVLNLAEMRLYYYPATAEGEPGRVITYPVGIGRQGWETPTGRTTVVEKIPDPKWLPPESVRAEHAERGDILPAVVMPGPMNPLGHRAMRLGWTEYMIHGTNKPYGIGMAVSHGCIRLYPEDIEALFEQVAVGTPVYIVDQPYKAGWRDGILYLQAYPSLLGKPELTKAVQAVIAATEDEHDVIIDWKRVMEAAREASGIAVPVSRPPVKSEHQEARNDP